MWPAKGFEGIFRPLIIKKLPRPGVRDRRSQHLAAVASQELLISLLLAVTRATRRRKLRGAPRWLWACAHTLSSHLPVQSTPGWWPLPLWTASRSGGCSWECSAWCLPPVLYGSIFELVTFAPFPFFFSFVVLWNQLFFFSSFFFFFFLFFFFKAFPFWQGLEGFVRAWSRYGELLS